ncbi:hypothetical protein [Vibrio parahaemolyticus]|uniref:hypothetical protein n=1 Tax=Vibrio parahaemolyticus TaxID=670 RepID=UPI001938A390|nr:hypothetical protein [Vibrio parahaemolyticus]QQD02198.1 hypothetical protein JCT85_08650 [Vibrio parahaemolyticus]
MNFGNCFHEICHLWVMVYKLGVGFGRAYLAYDNGKEGMLTIEGFRNEYNDYSDLVNGAEFIVAGIVGDKINDELPSHDCVFKLFSNHYSYAQDYKWFKKLYITAERNHSIEKSESEWFHEHFQTIELYLMAHPIDILKSAATSLLENGQFVLENKT